MVAKWQHQLLDAKLPVTAALLKRAEESIGWEMADKMEQDGSRTTR